MNRRRLATSGEGWGPIYGLRCFLTSIQRERMLHLLPKVHLTVKVCQKKWADFLRHPITVAALESRRSGKVAGSSACKTTKEAHGFRRCVVGYVQ